MRLSRSRIRLELNPLKGWTLRGIRIQRTFRFDNFLQGLRFVNKVGRLAEDMNHHPDILINYDKVRMSLTTHDERGLTVKDFKLARRINRLVKS